MTTDPILNISILCLAVVFVFGGAMIGWSLCLAAKRADEAVAEFESDVAARIQHTKSKCETAVFCSSCARLQAERDQFKGFEVVLKIICDIACEYPLTNEGVTDAVRRIKNERDKLKAENDALKRHISGILS